MGRSKIKCQDLDCNKEPSYGNDGGPPKYCSTHGKALGLTNVKKKICQTSGCSKAPSYGLQNKKPTHCKDHGQPLGMSNVTAIKCVLCPLIASFGVPGTMAVTHCQMHGEPLGLINVRANMCQQTGCKTQATYGESGTKKALYCSQHGKSRGLLDVVNAQCATPGCKVNPTYGETCGKPTHCSLHGKPLGFIDVFNKKCTHCDNVANFGFEGGNPSKCSEHGLPLGFINLNGLKAKKCIYPGCSVQPSYGQPGGEADYCAKHGKPLGLIDVYHKRCAVEGCDKYPAFAVEDGKPASVCHDHGNELEYVRVNYRRCSYIDEAFGDRCTVQVRDPHVLCASHEPGRSTRVAENVVANFLRTDIDVPWTSWNKQVTEAVCGGHYRPDFTWDRTSWALVLENDEHQHARSGYTCDEKRMVDIFNGYGGISVVFIRFNPDSFKINNRNRTVTMQKRLEMLKKEIDHFHTNPPKNQFEIHRMFYDCPSEQYVQRVSVDFSTGNFKETAISGT